jgi:hypothetical protein
MAVAVPRLSAAMITVLYASIFLQVSAFESTAARQIERMSPEQYRLERERRGPLALDRPILVEGVMAEAQCESICHTLMTVGGSFPIQIQRKRRQIPGADMTTKTDLYECSLEQAFDFMMQSNHDDSVFAFVEGLLDSVPSFDALRAPLTHAKESLFPEDSPNWFDYFPEDAKPSDCAVLAGEGATSTLHRDPFEWTGTSLCLEGTKIWRFIPPPGYVEGLEEGDVEKVDKALESYKLESIAWGDDMIALSAGWQSDLSLFANRDHDMVPSARELSEMIDSDRIALLESIACSTSALTPSIREDVLSRMHLPSSSNPTNKPEPPFWCSTVQRQGDILLIPPYWYHQTYAAEPSLAVSSQRCGSLLDARRVLSHVLNVAGKKTKSPPAELLKDSYAECEPRKIVDILFEFLA